MDGATLRRCYTRWNIEPMNKDFEALIIAEVPSDDSTSLGEKMLLYWLIRELKPEIVVETGTHRGLTTLYMLAALYDNGKGHLHTCDPNPQWGQVGNFAKFPNLLPYVSFYEEKGFSMLQKIKNIDFAFIDGFHGKQDVLPEIGVLLSNISERATVVFHDCWYGNTDGVNEAIEEVGLHTIWLPTTNAIRIYSKHEDRPTG